MVLAAFTGHLFLSPKALSIYTSPNCLFNIESKLSLVEIESEYMLIWITERTSEYSCAVHGSGTVYGGNAPSLNGEDHHLVSQSNCRTCIYRMAKGSQQIV